MLAKVFSSALLGIDAYPIEIEVDVTGGLPAVVVVGLPDTAIKESRDRIRSAIRNSQFNYPANRITVNLAPADTKKEGACFDLPIALGILAATGQIPAQDLERFIIIGELALDGTVKPIRGALPIALSLKGGNKSLLLPEENSSETAFVEGIDVYSIKSLKQAAEFLSVKEAIPRKRINCYKRGEDTFKYDIDMSDVKGQHYAKRALEVAVGGAHNILFIGPPGSGKTMLARRIPTILPDMVLEEALEVTRIHSVVGLVPAKTAVLGNRPFRSPHHTASDVALAGGGTFPSPGEVSLAHHGVLFLDELPEFHRDVLETLRQPLEDGFVSISRISKSLTFPSRFMLACAMNPCPCGYYGDRTKVCRCSPGQIHRYRSKVSGPLLDRIDIHIEVNALNFKELSAVSPSGETSADIRARVTRARQIQNERFGGDGIFCNSHMNHKQLKKFCILKDSAKELLHKAMTQMELSARAYDKILKVARTIADLSGEKDIDTEHIAEAIQYRALDREMF